MGVPCSNKFLKEVTDAHTLIFVIVIVCDCRVKAVLFWHKKKFQFTFKLFQLCHDFLFEFRFCPEII